jgi:hypothetical protein
VLVKIFNKGKGKMAQQREVFIYGFVCVIYNGTNHNNKPLFLFPSSVFTTFQKYHQTKNTPNFDKKVIFRFFYFFFPFAATGFDLAAEGGAAFGPPGLGAGFLAAGFGAGFLPAGGFLLVVALPDFSSFLTGAFEV